MRAFLRSTIVLCASALLSTAGAQSLDSVLALLKADNAWTLEQQKSICEIAAPPFREAARAAEFKRRLAALGLPTRVDSVGNVIAERTGAGPGPTVVLSGHLDTVFPDGTDVTVSVARDRLTGPGIGDNCRGLAVVLAVARAMQRVNLKHAGSVIFVGNVGEEGPGNLRGMRHLFDRELGSRVDYLVAVDGAGLGLVSAAVGSRRYRVTYRGPGGHSYGAFGIPNPIHALGRAIAAIADLRVKAAPKTTFNVGVISGGTSVNSIPFAAVMEIDLRSESAEALRSIDRQVQRIIHDALDAENGRWRGERAARSRLTLTVDTIGIRPTGHQSDSARIVQVAIETARALGFSPSPGAASTDANVPISLGIPGISIDGGGRGGGAHSLDEWYEDGSNGWLGPQWAALVVARLAGVR